VLILLPSNKIGITVNPLRITGPISVAGLQLYPNPLVNDLYIDLDRGMYSDARLQLCMVSGF
jgi:hypothetical protein